MYKPNTRGIYIHIPFCKSKCPYCDFYSTPRHSEADIEDFVQALEAEIRYYGKIYGRGAEHGKAGGTAVTEAAAFLPIDSIYFGGGTPSLLSEAQFARIMRVLGENFEICTDVEISMEANPATVTEEKLAAYKAAGLNRLSIGAQSFDPAVLKLLGRLHKPEHTAEAVETARKVGIDNVSIDLMFGISGQSEESWEESVRQAIELKPKHISLYTLEIMDGTRFARDLEKGFYHQTDEDSDRRMYETALKLLEEAGLHQYEISNASTEGFECRHNLRYWNMSEYLGFGPSAHSFVCNARYANCADTGRYIEVMKDLAEEAEGGRRCCPQENGRAAAAAGGAVCSCDAPPASAKGSHAASLSQTAAPLSQEIQDSQAAARLLTTAAADDFHLNTERDSISEYMFTGLRRTAGISKEDFRENFGRELWEVFADERGKFDTFVRGGFAEDDETGIRLTRAGMNISNRIMLLFV